jgi:hypothetical protein
MSKKWKMPEWMEPYRELVNNTGGNSVEELENDTSTSMFINAPRAILCCCVHSQVQLLTMLHNKGLM